MKVTIAILLVLSFAAPVFAQADDADVASRTFESAALAYAYAAAIESPLVVRRDTGGFVVFIGRKPSASQSLMFDSGNSRITNGTATLYFSGSTVKVSPGDFLCDSDITSLRSLRASDSLVVSGAQVVSSRKAAIADADGTLNSATTQLNRILAAMREHGLISK